MKHTYINETIEISDWVRLPAEPVVSVYMLAYRHEKFIAQAIDRVLSQRCEFSFELIIGEDCSPDGTGEIVRDYQRRYPQKIRVLTARQNVGIHANAARCRHACRGEFVALCEGDDYWHCPDKLALQVAMMRSDETLSACHTDYDRLTRFRRKESAHRESKIPPAQGEAYESLLCHWTAMTATTMFRKELIMDFMRSPFYVLRWPFGDLNLLLYASLHGRFGYIDRSTATFRKVRGSATNSSFQAQLHMQQALYECVDMFINTFPPSTEMSSIARAIRQRRIYRAALAAGDINAMEGARTWLLEHEFEFNEDRHRIDTRMIQMGWPHRLLSSLRHFIDSRLSAI